MKKFIIIGLILLVAVAGCNIFHSAYWVRGNVTITIKNTLPSDIVVWFADDTKNTFDITAFTEQAINYNIKNDTDIVLYIKNSEEEYSVIIAGYVEPMYYGTAEVIVKQDVGAKKINTVVNSHITF